MSIQSAQFKENIPLTARIAEDVAPNAEGLFMGSKVTQNDPMSLLADAAEELTFSMAESEESRLDERKEKTERKKRPSDHFVALAEKMVEESGEKYKRPINHLEQLFKSRNNASLAELMEALKQAGRQDNGEFDPADEFVLLAGLKKRLGDGHSLTGTGGIIDQALDHLAEKENFNVASGLAVDLAAQDFADLGGKDLRGAYRGAVADFGSAREALTRLHEHFGLDKLDQGLDFLMTVLGNELSSSGPSVEKPQIKALTGDLAVVRVLGTVQKRCAAVLDRLDKAHGVKSRADSDQLLDALLSARDNQYVGSQDFQRLTALVGIPDTEREVLFLQDLLQGLRDLPDLFYETNETRLRVQGAGQGALDDAVRREEEEMGF